MRLDNDQASFAQQCVAEWIRISEENGHSCSPSDAGHSALLRRLLNGEKPLDRPPPKRYSYPCYSLGEGRATEVHEVWESVLHNERVVVDQCRDWKWVDKEKGWLIHIPTCEVYRLWTEMKTRQTAVEPYDYEAKFLQKVGIDYISQENAREYDIPGSGRTTGHDDQAPAAL